jgi:hypothetical protein
MTTPKQMFANAYQKVQAHLRRIWLVASAVAAFAGLALNWDWLTAAGLAPIILGVLPCVVMCALGLCAHRFTGGPASSFHGSEAQSNSEDKR